MKLVDYLARTLVISGVLYLAIWSIPIATDLYQTLKSIRFYVPLEGTSSMRYLSLIWLVFGKIVTALTYGLGAISLGLILIHLFNFSAAPLRRWFQWAPRYEGLPLGLIVAKTLKFSAVSLMIVMAGDAGQSLVRAYPDYFVPGALSIIVTTLMLGSAGVAIAIILEKLQRASMDVDSPSEPLPT